MEKTHLFCGIFIDNAHAYASVLNRKGNVLLCNQYLYELPDDHFPDILDNLRHFADIHNAFIHIAFLHSWDAHVPRDPHCPHDKDILRISYHEFDNTNLFHPSYSPNSQYHKPKLLALLSALRYVTADSLENLSPDNKQIP